jgi:anthranilate phosphoribosyltransferase
VGEDLALVNAGAAIYAAGRADTIAEGVDAARSAVAQGAAAEALESYVQVSRSLAPEAAAQ